MAADRGVAGVVGWADAQLGLRPAEQVLDHEQFPVAEHGIEWRHAGIGAQHEDAVGAGLLGELAGVYLERLARARAAQIGR